MTFYFIFIDNFIKFSIYTWKKQTFTFSSKYNFLSMLTSLMHTTKWQMLSLRLTTGHSNKDVSMYCTHYLTQHRFKKIHDQESRETAECFEDRISQKVEIVLQETHKKQKRNLADTFCRVWQDLESECEKDSPELLRIFTLQVLHYTFLFFKLTDFWLIKNKPHNLCRKQNRAQLHCHILHSQLFHPPWRTQCDIRMLKSQLHSGNESLIYTHPPGKHGVSFYQTFLKNAFCCSRLQFHGVKSSAAGQ